MNKLLKLKSGNDLDLTVIVIGANGLPVNLNYLKSLEVKLAKQGGSTFNITPTINGSTMVLALTDTTELGSDGIYSLQIAGSDANGNNFSFSDQIIEVAADGADVTSYGTTVVIPTITQPGKDSEYVIADGDTVKLQDGMKIVGTGLNSVAFDYPVNSSFNATALLSFRSGASTHDASMPSGFRYIGTLATEAANKTYLYTWVRGVLTQIAEVKS